jgi:hypothetical protein
MFGSNVVSDVLQEKFSAVCVKRRLGSGGSCSGGQCVRLVSQSSDHLPLSAVDGSQLDATQIHHGLLARSQLDHQFIVPTRVELSNVGL